jgi:beta-glucosidase
MSFRNDFVWGTATASYQIEGAWNEDGKGLSVWDMFSRRKGAVWEGHTGDVACDHYHRYKEDVAIMKDVVGAKAYRFSISWPRVIPDGVGAANEKGLAFYDRLVDELLAKGVTPWVTLFHWDYPLALYHRGGWFNRESVEWFAEYTRVVVDRLGDRVSHWMTLNEPQCFIGLGHSTGAHAPGDKHNRAQVLLANHHALMAHGRAVQVIRERAKVKPSIGFAPVGIVRYPADDSPATIEAARKAMFSIEDMLWNDVWYSDPVFFGAYPEEGLRLYGDDVPRIHPGDMELMAQPLDFYGVNIYHGAAIAPDGKGGFHFPGRGIGYPLTRNDWPVEPQALYWGPRFLYERYKLPIVITENGTGGLDWVHLDGQCHDPQRIDFLHRYLRELKRAAADGVDIRGYFLWSLLDNFEWNEGYRQRFGLVHVDYNTQKRTPKDSAHWYAKVIATNGASLD